ncbi:MAG: AraC family transcriptional regulator [Terriglobales bacterium]|jgi:AraC family transcriptional regulator
MAEGRQRADGGQALTAGSFYGAIRGKRELCGAIFTDLLHESARKLPSHSHELPFFGLVMDGQYGERYGREQTFFTPFTIMFRPAGIPHQDEIGPRGVKFFEIELRPSWRKRLDECSGTLDRAYADCAGGQALWLGLKLYRELHSGVADELATESLLGELLACVGCQPREGSTDRSPEGSKARPAWLGRVLDKIGAEYNERLTLDQLSAEAGVHPVHLSRVFRRWHGQGVGEFIHRLRIRAACERLLQLEMPIAEIGLAAGFADQSHFTRSFRRVTGISPARFRGMVAQQA